MLSNARFLRWIYLMRMVLAAGIFAAALLVWTQPQVAPEATLVAALMLVLTLGFTAGSFWHTDIVQQTPSANFLYAQVLFDVVLVTAVVHVTGRAESDFVPLYVLVITEGALLLPFRGGLLVGVLAILLYGLDAVFGGGFAQVLGGVAAESGWSPSALVQMALFTAIMLATVALAERLRRAGSELGEVQSELRQLRLETSDILGTLDTGVVTLDSDGVLAYMNPAAEMLLGVDGRDWLGRSALEEMDRMAPGLGWVVERTLSSRGPVRWYETEARGTSEARVLGIRTTKLERDDHPWVTVVVQDITDGKRVEALHRRAERLEAVTELAASLAHEIKNPLASIRSAVEQLTVPRSRLEDRDRSVLSDLVLVESDRLSRLLSEFIEFSRVELRKREVFDLKSLVDNAVALVRQHPDAAEAVIEVEGRSAQMEGDTDLVHRAALNLVLNAVQHSPSGVPVRVRVGPVDESDLPPGARFTSAARLDVTDRGAGIDADVLGRVFDPFFTTRAGGSGLGLSLVHRAVEVHEGLTFIDSEPGEGTTFTVYFPSRMRQGDR